MDNSTIVFSDMTINDGCGDRIAVSSLMSSEIGDRDWMLSSDATVTSHDVTINYLLHFWKNGQIYIVKTDRPLSLDVPDDDLRYLREWCENNGWGQLIIEGSLLRAPAGFEFWLRMYQAGIIHADELQKHDNNEMERLSQAYIAETEDNDAD